MLFIPPGFSFPFASVYLRLRTFFFVFFREESYKFAAPCDTVAALDKLFSQMGLSETSALAAKASWFEVGGCEIKPVDECTGLCHNF